MPRALQTFHTEDRLVARDSVVGAHDPIVKGREHFFAFDDVDENAPRSGSARPGQAKRGPGRPRKG